MGDMLTQAEIDALLNGTPLGLEASVETSDVSDVLSPQEIDALGEIGNISMGTSATTLFTLLGQKVTITTPNVAICTLNSIAKDHTHNYIGVKVEYINGLIGSNLLLLKEHDVKIIADLMMGGDGTKGGENLNDLHLSAISEAMNQMIGSSSTSMSTMFNKRIEISPPTAFILGANTDSQGILSDENEYLVKIAFKMVVGNLIDSQIMQILPISFAKRLVDELLNTDPGSGSYELPDTYEKPSVQRTETWDTKPEAAQPQQLHNQHYMQTQQDIPPKHEAYSYGHGEADMWSNNRTGAVREPVNVQPAQFQAFDDDSRITLEKRNIGMIMDVPLQVTVELGKTQKPIKDILGFGPGSIIELDKLAGEPVDILVNGKPIARGEVVVIDESFGVRVTDIIHPSKRI